MDNIIESIFEPYEYEMYKHYFESNPTIIKQLDYLFGDFTKLIDKSIWELSYYIGFKLDPVSLAIIGIKYLINYVGPDIEMDYPCFTHLTKEYFQPFPELEMLKFSGNKKVDKIDEDALIFNKNLKVLVMADLQIIEYPTKFFSSFLNLTTLRISHHLKFFDFTQLHNNQNITELSIDSGSFENIEFIQQLSKLKVLRIFTNNKESISKIMNIKNNSLMDFSIFFREVYREVSDPSDFPEVLINESLAENLPNLCAITFQNMRFEQLPETILNLPLVSFSHIFSQNTEYKWFHQSNFRIRGDLVNGIQNLDQKKLLNTQNNLKDDLKNIYM